MKNQGAVIALKRSGEFKHKLGTTSECRAIYDRCVARPDVYAEVILLSAFEHRYLPEPQNRRAERQVE